MKQFWIGFAAAAFGMVLTGAGMALFVWWALGR